MGMRMLLKASIVWLNRGTPQSTTQTGEDHPRECGTTDGSARWGGNVREAVCDLLTNGVEDAFWLPPAEEGNEDEDGDG